MNVGEMRSCLGELGLVCFRTALRVKVAGAVQLFRSVFSSVYRRKTQGFFRDRIFLFSKVGIFFFSKMCVFRRPIYIFAFLSFRYRFRRSEAVFASYFCVCVCDFSLDAPNIVLPDFVFSRVSLSRKEGVQNNHIVENVIFT